MKFNVTTYPTVSNIFILSTSQHLKMKHKYQKSNLDKFHEPHT